ncbi:MAG TPA: 4Fe-4S dicluster domain-containing protein [Buttiauxella sp.]
MKTEQKITKNYYSVGNKPHIVPASCVSSETRELLVKSCPAGLYQIDEDGSLQVETQGCLECGTCRLLVDEQTFTLWRYPGSGYGIQLRFG